jgi:hypothetical protein
MNTWRISYSPTVGGNGALLLSIHTKHTPSQLAALALSGIYRCVRRMPILSHIPYRADRAGDPAMVPVRIGTAGLYTEVDRVYQGRLSDLVYDYLIQPLERYFIHRAYLGSLVGALPPEMIYSLMVFRYGPEVAERWKRALELAQQTIAQMVGHA